MIAYYEVVKSLRDFLQDDPEINTVAIGGFDDVDVNKQSIYGIGHILVNTASFVNGMVRFDITVSVMDIVDERKNNRDLLPADEQWKGQDNKQDVLNTMLSVVERLTKEISNGDLMDNGYELIGNPTSTPFEDRFENLLTGWSTDYTIDIPNTIQNCS